MNKSKDRKILKEYLSAIVVSISGFFESEISIKIMMETKLITEFIDQIALKLKDKETSGWDGSDLGEDQLNALTIISEFFQKRNKSKYKNIENLAKLLRGFQHGFERCTRHKATRLSKRAIKQY